MIISQHQHLIGLNYNRKLNINIWINIKISMLKNERFWIGTTRFNNKTFNENKDWRAKHNWKGCIYGVDKYMSTHPKASPPNGLIYVLEMNNETNKIMGIGIVRNKINHDDKALINFTDRHYNKYIYHSKYRIDSSEFTELQKKYIDILEIILFKGQDHFKRGNGITILKWKSLLNDEIMGKFVRFFRGLF
jgi:hypothetical protein